jgi:hypothetical protein
MDTTWGQIKKLLSEEDLAYFLQNYVEPEPEHHIITCHPDMYVSEAFFENGKMVIKTEYVSQSLTLI